MSLNSGPGSESGVSCDFGVTWNLPIVPGNPQAFGLLQDWAWISLDFPDFKIILTRWGRVTHIYIVKLTIIGSDNGLSPGRRQAIIWTNAGILLIGPLGTNFIEILVGIQTFSFKRMHLKMSSAKWRPFYLGLNVLRRFTSPTCVLSSAVCWPVIFSFWNHPRARLVDLLARTSGCY